ncbi:MAG: phosphate ABC transporter permease PstA [Desulfobacterota bacterium]|nr:phosphate ABC transporter permease PstA [Thermodesulfobacteriota bacterium]
MLQAPTLSEKKRSINDMNGTGVLLRIFKDYLFQTAVIVGSITVFVPLLLILGYIVRNGIAAVDWQFLTGPPRPIGEPGGGIANAIIGSAMLIVIASIIAVPIGIATGIYLSENRSSRAAVIVRMCIDILQGIPSIVVGIIAYAWIVVSSGTFSALSGGVALAFIMLPVIIRATEETMNMIPDTIREASLALGVSYTRTVLKVLVPAGVSGILTGILLSIARIAGETAPLLFTSFGNPYMSTDIFKPVDSLPHIIFNYAISPYPEWHTKAWGAALVLIVFVLGLNISAKILTRRWTVRF